MEIGTRKMEFVDVLKLTCKHLRIQLKDAGLSAVGRKHELQERLMEYIQTSNAENADIQGIERANANTELHSEQKAKLEALELEIEILKKQREVDRLRLSEGKTNAGSPGDDIKEALVDAVYASHVEIVEPTVFEGDPLQYTVWKIRFRSLIESPRIRKGDRLNVLAKYLKGKALGVIQHLFFANSDDSFEKAAKLLDDRFGDSYNISESFRSRLEHWPTVKPDDNEALFELSDFVKQCVEVKKHVPGLSVLDDGRENQKLLRCLPVWFINKWRERIVDYKEHNNNVYPPI